MTELIPLDQLHHHPDNPATRHTTVDDLAASIRAVGILQPLLVEPDPAGGYVVIAGNRRLAAAQVLELPAVECKVRESHGQIAHTAVRLIENGHRRDLSPIQQARAFAVLRDSGLNQPQIAQRTGFSSGHVSDRLALLELDDATQDRVDRGVIRLEDALAAVRAARGNSTAKRAQQAHLGWSHPLAKPAEARCNALHGIRGGGLIGGTACGACWEFVIRADERWQIEEGDAPAPEPILDEVKIQRAVSGHKVKLTKAERDEAVRRLRSKRVSAAEAGYRLGISDREVQRITAAVTA